MFRRHNLSQRSMKYFQWGRLLSLGSFFKQLHNFVFGGGVVSSIFLLCPSILAFRFGMQK